MDINKKVRTNESNFEILKDKLLNAEKTIDIASGWIRGEILHKLIDNQLIDKWIEKKLKIKFLIRIGSLKDVEISGDSFFRFFNNLRENLGKDKVELRFSKHHHAKMYIIDESFAMIGSFNLTGGGFGTKDFPGTNPEAGVILENANEVKESIDTFNKFWKDAQSVDFDELIGFVMNNANNYEFNLLGIREIPAGSFVQINICKEDNNIYGDNNNDNDDNKSFILGKVKISYKYNGFFKKEDAENKDDFLIKNFGINDNLINTVRGLGFAGDYKEFQLNIAEVEIIKRFENNEVKLNSIPPDVLSLVYFAKKSAIDKVINSYKTNESENSKEYAYLYENKDIPIRLNLDEITNKHFAVFGTTGSGKSYFVKKLLGEVLYDYAKENNMRIIIIDTHGEYVNEEFIKALNNKNILINENIYSKYVSNENDLEEIIDSKFSKEQKNILKQVFLECNNDKDIFLEKLKAKNDKDKVSIDWDAKFDLDKKLEIALEDKQFKNILKNLGLIHKKENDRDKKNDSEKNKEYIEKEEIKKEYKDLINVVFKSKMKSINKVIDEYNKSIFSDELIDKIEDLIKSNEIVFTNSNLKEELDIKNGYLRILDLSKIHDKERRWDIVYSLMKYIFNEAKENYGKDNYIKTLFIVDEAQNYAPEKGDSGNNAGKMMRTIASEGRKLGIGLFVITQRPAYISKNVITQCNSQAIFRMINEQDLKAIESSVEGISEGDLKRLPNLETGSCIFTGVAVKSPVLVKIKF